MNNTENNSHRINTVLVVAESSSEFEDKMEQAIDDLEGRAGWDKVVIMDIKFQICPPYIYGFIIYKELDERK